MSSNFTFITQFIVSENRTDCYIRKIYQKKLIEERNENYVTLYRGDIMNRTDCENKWCIYYEEGHCTLLEISVNSYGMCDDCIMLDPDETEMKIRRKRQVDMLEEQDEYWNYRIEEIQRKSHSSEGE